MELHSDIHVIRPFNYDGQIAANSSKSYLQRVLLLAGLSNKPSNLFRFGWTDDGRHMATIIEQLGANISEASNHLQIHPFPKEKKSKIDLHVGESGLALRMLASVSSMLSKRTLISGEGSLLQRPIDPIIRILNQCGLNIQQGEGNVLLDIQGELSTGHIVMDASFSSQLVSGILISLPLLVQSTRLTLKNPVSRPYIDMTLDVMQSFGVEIEQTGYSEFFIKGGQAYTGHSAYSIEGDWSGAANHLVGAAISGKCTIDGLNIKSAQADRHILDILADYGADILISQNDEITVKKNESLPIACDITDCPDLFPCLVILAASCKGESEISGIQRLFNKESNRLEVMMREFSNLGLTMRTTNNKILIKGTGKLSGGRINTRNDHRIAMAAAIAGTICSENIEILDPSCVNKSYPDFFKDLAECTKSR